MEKIALVTDSACDIDNQTISKYNIRILPFKIIYNHGEYTDKVDITPEYVYNNMKTEIPKSSLPSMEDIETMYKKLTEENYNHVIAAVISSGLSGTYNAFRLVSEKFGNIKTYIFDSKSTSLVQGIILKKCGESIEKGMKFKEIIKMIPEFKRKLHFFFVFGTLEYAKKGGRIGKVSGTIGDLLDIKPIVGFDEEYGQCFTYKKIRGRNNSLKKLADIVDEIKIKGKCSAYIVHGNSEDDAKKLCDMLRKKTSVEGVYLIGQISAIVGVYSGPGTVGVCYCEN